MGKRRETQSDFEVLILNGRVASFERWSYCNGRRVMVFDAKRHGKHLFSVLPHDPEVGNTRRVFGRSIGEAAGKTMESQAAEKLVALFELEQATESRVRSLLGHSAHQLQVTVDS